MAKTDESGTQPGREGVISIIGPGMKVTGDCESEGTLRIEGTVEGTVRAGKAVVVGKDGVVDGDITTQDAVVGGRVTGSIIAESRLELQATCVVEGEIEAKRIKLEEGGTVNGTVQIGQVSAKRAPGPSGSSGSTGPGSGSTGSGPTGPSAPGSAGSGGGPKPGGPDKGEEKGSEGSGGS
ncbi:MAG: bactofilin family protein [Candidatus Longimicrobiales bacterium M2_2A_002]